MPNTVVDTDSIYVDLFLNAKYDLFDVKVILNVTTTDNYGLKQNLIVQATDLDFSNIKRPETLTMIDNKLNYRWIHDRKRDVEDINFVWNTIMDKHRDLIQERINVVRN